MFLIRSCLSLAVGFDAGSKSDSSISDQLFAAKLAELNQVADSNRKFIEIVSEEQQRSITMSRFDNIKEFLQEQRHEPVQVWGRSASRNPAEVAMSQSATSWRRSKLFEDCGRH